MKKIIYASICLLSILGIYTACNNASKMSKSESTASHKETLAAGEVVSDKAQTKNGITLTPVLDSPQFPEADMMMHRLKNTNQQPGRVYFDFEIKNYYLGQQTPDAEQKMCANSKQGQHIHHIINGEPYSAYYIDTASKVLAEGHYISLAFLSRSYHESVKNPKSTSLHQFNVGKPAKGDDIDLNGPLLFYSRPKGDYIGEKDIKRVMLDFYLVNTDLEKDHNRVKATINGTEFLLGKWVPYMMEGLPEGENTIKLELIDQNGKNIPGPYNIVERKINLYKSEPLPQKK